MLGEMHTALVFAQLIFIPISSAPRIRMVMTLSHSPPESVSVGLLPVMWCTACLPRDLDQGGIIHISEEGHVVPFVGADRFQSLDSGTVVADQVLAQVSGGQGPLRLHHHFQGVGWLHSIEGNLKCSPGGCHP